MTECMDLLDISSLYNPISRVNQNHDGIVGQDMQSYQKQPNHRTQYHNLNQQMLINDSIQHMNINQSNNHSIKSLIPNNPIHNKPTNHIPLSKPTRPTSTTSSKQKSIQINNNHQKKQSMEQPIKNNNNHQKKQSIQNDRQTHQKKQSIEQSIQSSHIRSPSEQSDFSRKSRPQRSPGLIDVAYKDQIAKRHKNKRSLSSVSSSSSLDSSFQAMELRLRKSNNQAEMIDQKYMIGGFFQIIKDHKRIIEQFRAQMQRMSQVIVGVKGRASEEAIVAVDQYFEEYATPLRAKVQEFYLLQTSLERLIRMNIHEPYLLRAKRRAAQANRQRSVFEFIEVYLSAFDFLRNEAYQYFEQEERLTDDLQLPPSEMSGIQQRFFARVQQVRDDLESTGDNEEGRMITQIFQQKIDKIVEWHSLVHRCLRFRYEFNVKYNLDNAGPSYKIIKSKKLYQVVVVQYKEIQEFLVENFSMPEMYLNRLEEMLEEIKQIKQQVLHWNQKLRSQQKYHEIMSLIQFNKKLKIANKQIQTFIQLMQEDDGDIQDYQIQSTDLVIQVQLWHQKMQDLLIQYYSSEDIKNDEYIQKIFNKAVMQITYYEELKEEIDQY